MRRNLFKYAEEGAKLPSHVRMAGERERFERDSERARRKQLIIKALIGAGIGGVAGAGGAALMSGPQNRLRNALIGGGVGAGVGGIAGAGLGGYLYAKDRKNNTWAHELNRQLNIQAISPERRAELENEMAQDWRITKRRREALSPLDFMSRHIPAVREAQDALNAQYDIDPGTDVLRNKRPSYLEGLDQ